MSQQAPASDEQFPRPSDELVAENDRHFRAWLRGEDTAPGAYDDALEGHRG